MSDDNAVTTLTPEERLAVSAMARTIAWDLLKIPKLPMRRAVLDQVVWLLEGAHEYGV